MKMLARAALLLSACLILTGSELVPLYQGGQRVAVTITQIATFFGSAPPPTGTALDFSSAANSAFIL